nr:ATP-dependent zinc metalloprotease FtsH [Helcococcus sueciensis]
MNKKRQSFMPLLSTVLMFVIIVSIFSRIFDTTNNISVNELLKFLSSDNVTDVTTQGNKVEIITKDKQKYTTVLPEEFQRNFYKDYLENKVENNSINYKGIEQSESNYIIQFLPSLIMLAGMGFIFYMLLAKGANTNNQAMKFGKSRASLHLDKNNSITFKDVAGLKEEKEEMTELVDFLKNPKRYVEQGARIPKGVLLVGSPGTGKTFISKAVAGEAKVPFYSISGSDFVEMFVGVGASRVRDMFQEAKKNAPCIIFIDEIDAVGRKRGSGLGGGHDEREQTLNQLLVEMDGFSKNEGVIIIAATNRPDILDPALLRPGRFDRTIQISMPDVREREEMLKVHTKNKKLSSEVNLNAIARSTAGFSPAEIENLTNEAALLAARNRQDEITPDLLEEASIRIMAGPEKKSRVVIERERVLTAYHEAGHAVTAEIIKGLDPVHIITIIPRGDAGGFTAYLPEEDRSFRTKTEMTNRLVALLGGRAAEDIVLGDISTGASNDIERATGIARAMIKTYGFSGSLGPVQYDDGSGNVFLGGDNYSKGDHYSEQTAIIIDKEVTDLIKNAYEKAKEIIVNNRDFLEELAQTLLKEETIRREKYLEIAKKYTEVEDVYSKDVDKLIDFKNTSIDEKNEKIENKNDENKGE